MATIPKREIADHIAETTGISKTMAQDIVQELFDYMIEELAKGNRFEIREFGVFESVIRKPRIANIVSKNQRVTLPSRATVIFKPGKRMKESLARAFQIGDFQNGRKT